MSAKSTLLAGEVASLAVKATREVSGVLLGIKPGKTGPTSSNPGAPMWTLRFAGGSFNMLESTDASKCPKDDEGLALITAGLAYHCVWDGPRSTIVPLNVETGEVEVEVNSESI